MAHSNRGQWQITRPLKITTNTSELSLTSEQDSTSVVSSTSRRNEVTVQSDFQHLQTISQPTLPSHRFHRSVPSNHSLVLPLQSQLSQQNHVSRRQSDEIQTAVPQREQTSNIEQAPQTNQVNPVRRVYRHVRSNIASQQSYSSQSSQLSQDFISQPEILLHSQS